MVESTLNIVQKRRQPWRPHHSTCLYCRRPLVSVLCSLLHFRRGDSSSPSRAETTLTADVTVAPRRLEGGNRIAKGTSRSSIRKDERGTTGAENGSSAGGKNLRHIRNQRKSLFRSPRSNIGQSSLSNHVFNLIFHE